MGDILQKLLECTWSWIKVYGLCANDEMLCHICVSLLTVCDVFPLQLDPCCFVQIG